MQSGFYSAVNGAMRAETRLDVLANNLANVNSTGFKREEITFDSYLTSPGPEQFPLPTDSFLTPLGPGNIPFPFSSPATNAYRVTYPTAAMTRPDFSPGPMMSTERPMDVAIEGEGFFAIQTGKGIEYTRDGAFHVNQLGELVTTDGSRVLGEGNSALVVGQNAFEIAYDGTISSAEGQAGRLMRVKLDPVLVKKVGDNRYTVPAGSELPVGEGEGGFRSGFLEGSNSDTVGSMTGMIETHRQYNLFLQMVKALDQLENQAANNIGQIQG